MSLDLLDQGNTLSRLGRHREALERYARILETAPDHLDALNNRGVALTQLGCYDEALASFERVLALSPARVDTLNNYGNLLRRLGRYAESLAQYSRAQAVSPDFVDAHWNESICHLLMGDYRAGWKKYEWRWRNLSLNLRARTFAQPPWLGAQDLRGKTILLHAEQGLGDMIQFARYAPLVAAKGATVLLEVLGSLVPLMAGLTGVSRVLARGEPLPAIDCHCPLLSLPLAFDTTLETVPASVPYLSVDPEAAARWRARLAPAGEKLIGVSWRGNPLYENDRERSVRFADFVPLLSSVTGVRFVSLQKELTDEERRLASALPQLVHPGADFQSTAEMIAALDLVIAVDTAWAHWAGAIGRPFWMLLPFTPHWVWLTGREDSPWYPTARLFRQSKIGDWEGVIGNVKRELAKWRDTV